MIGIAEAIDELLMAYPLLRVKPSVVGLTVIEGKLVLPEIRGCRVISDSFRVRIEVPGDFPRELPKVFELEKRIPSDGFHHLNPDKSLCLGSPIRVRGILLGGLAECERDHALLLKFVDLCVTPFLYGFSYKENFGTYPFGELAHGNQGILNDYSSLLGIPEDRVLAAISLLTLRKRLANKRPCPCNCGRRLGVCRFNRRIARLRPIASRQWFGIHFKQISK